MGPAGYMAKQVVKKPDWLHAAQVEDIYSVSGCISPDFADCIHHWKHNGYWYSIRLKSSEYSRVRSPFPSNKLCCFITKAYERELDGEKWSDYVPDTTFPTHVVLPSH